MTVKCEVVRDLLPLYHDNVVSEESRAFVEVHIENCPNCEAFLQELQKDNALSSVTIDYAEIGAFKKMKKKIFRKTAFVAAIAGIMTLVLTGAYFNQNMPISYSEAGITGIETNVITAIPELYDENQVFIGDGEPIELPGLAVTTSVNVSGSGGVRRDLIVNGETVRIQYFQLVRSRGARADSNVLSVSQVWLTETDSPFVGRVEVYYTATNLSRLNAMNDDDFLLYRSSATLLWSDRLD